MAGLALLSIQSESFPRDLQRILGRPPSGCTSYGSKHRPENIYAPTIARGDRLEKGTQISKEF